MDEKTMAAMMSGPEMDTPTLERTEQIRMDIKAVAVCRSMPMPANCAKGALVWIIRAKTMQKEARIPKLTATDRTQLRRYTGVHGGPKYDAVLQPAVGSSPGIGVDREGEDGVEGFSSRVTPIAEPLLARRGLGYFSLLSL